MIIPNIWEIKNVPNHQPVYLSMNKSIEIIWNHTSLVVDLPLWKMMEWKSVGMMKLQTEWKVIEFHGSKPPTSLNLHFSELNRHFLMGFPGDNDL